MRSNERKLYMNEKDLLPNRYVSVAICLITCTVALILMLNEFGVFHVESIKMRYGAAISSLLLILPLLLMPTDKQLQDPRSKYLLLFGVEAALLVLNTLLCIHSLLTLVLPLVLGAQYPSRRMCRLAYVGSMICAILSPVLSLLLKVWDISFLKYLLALGLGNNVLFSPGEEFLLTDRIKSALLYISLPNALILTALLPLFRSISIHGEDRLRQQMTVLHMSESDALTGLLNRQSFEARMKQPPACSSLTCVYVDANDLHKTNNTYGHAAGDKLLYCVAQAMLEAFGDEQVFRIGGDEFVAIAPDLSVEKALQLLSEVRQNVESHGYSISAGMERATTPCSLMPLLNSAEAKMSAEKERYHIVR